MIDARPIASGVFAEGERRFRTLFDQTAVGMCFVGLDGTFVEANARLSEIVGFSNEELLATTCVALTHPDDHPREKIATMEMLSGATSFGTWEKRYVRKDGTDVWCNLTLTLLRDDRGEPLQFVGVIEDIGDRKRWAQKLEESESLLRIAGRIAHVGGWAFDSATETMSWSDEARTIFGEDAGASHERIVAAARSSCRTGVGFDLEFEIVRCDRARRWIRTTGQVDSGGVRIVGAIVDISESKATQSEMLRMNRSLKMLSGCNEVLVRATDENELLGDIARLVVEVGGFKMVWVGYARHDPGRTVEPVAIAGTHDDYFANMRIGWDAADPAGCGAAGQTIRSGRTTIVEDLETDPRFEPWRAEARKRDYRGVVVLPLHDGRRTFGVIGLHSTDACVLPEAEIELLQELARDLAFGICHLRARVERRRAQDAIVKIAAAVSARAGTAFLERLVTSMAEAVGAQAAFVIRPHPSDATKFRSLVAVIDGVTLEHVDFDSEGSPCNDVGLDDVFVVDANLAQRYPGCSVAESIGAESVVGWRLRDAELRTLATMMVFFREPIVELDFVTSTLQIFVARAAAELELQIADAKIADQSSWLDRARDAIVVRKIDGGISFWNQSAERLYGWTAQEILGTTLDETLFADSARLREATTSVVADGFWNGEVEYRRKDGSLVSVESRWSVVSDDDGVARSILAIDTDITQRNAAEREIEHLAFYDALTNLPNRLLLVQRLKAVLATDDGFGALLFIDLDNFKALNDTLGHDMGDLLLKAVALRLQSCVRGSDTVARFGGDEFVIVLGRLGSSIAEAMRESRRIAANILAASSAPYGLAGSEHCSTPSIGVTIFERGDNSDDLLKEADLAMYEAKAAGRNAVRFFDPKMQASALSRRALEDDIRAALRSDEFDIAYQPQVDATGNVIGAEALVRWSHEMRGPVAPVDFIPIAEESGLIVPLGRRVLELACARLVAWSARPANARLKLSVNVSAREFRHPDFVSHVLATLAATGANPRLLVLELTESVLVDEIEVVIAKMEALREIGIGIALDDFGTGYSSLSYLKRLPLNQLKIDRSFVRDVLVDPNDAVIARTIVALAQNLSLDVIAEGVETQAQRQFLASVGCRSFQGYFFSRPLASDAFDAYVAERTLHAK